MGDASAEAAAYDAQVRAGGGVHVTPLEAAELNAASARAKVDAAHEYLAAVTAAAAEAEVLLAAARDVEAARLAAAEAEEEV